MIYGFAILLTGCVTWEPTTVPPVGGPNRAPYPSSVRVTLEGGRTVTLNDAEVSSDSLVGDADGERVTIALAEIQRFERSEPSPGSAVVPIVGFLLIIAFIASELGESFGSAFVAR